MNLQFGYIIKPLKMCCYVDMLDVRYTLFLITSSEELTGEPQLAKYDAQLHLASSLIYPSFRKST